MSRWVTPEGSSTIVRFRYDAAEETLLVGFRSGDIYRYLEVPEDVATKMQEAESRGAYLAKSIKPLFRCVKLDPQETEKLTKGEE